MKLKEHLLISKRAVKMVFQQDYKFAICTILHAFIVAIIPYVPIYFSAKLVDALFEGESIEVLAFYVILTVGIVFLLQLLKTFIEHTKNKASNVIYRMEDWQYAKKAMEMAYESIETRDIQLLRNRIQKETQTGYNRFYLHMCMENAVRYTTQIICSLSLTVSFFTNKTIPLYMKLALLLLVILTSVIGIILTAKQQKAVGDFYDGSVFMNIFSEKFDNYVNDYIAGMDIRLYNMSNGVAECMLKLNKDYTNKSLKLSKRLTALSIPQVF